MRLRGVLSNKRKETVRVRSKAFYTFTVLAIIYASVNLFAAPPRASLQHYHISSTTLRIIDSTFIFPVIAIWFIGLYGFQKLRAYAGYVQDNKEGKQLMELTRGIMVLAWWLPVTSTLSTVLSLQARYHPQLLAPITVLTNYLTLLFPLVAFVFISRGGRRLSEAGRKRPGQGSVHLLALILIIMAISYSYLITKTNASSLDSIYHMPVELVLLTLVIPYVFTWYLGLLAVNDMHTYTRMVKGLIFRSGWNYLSFGVAWIVVMCIVFQFITTVSVKLGNLSLPWVLMLIYGILAVMAAGYVFIALGAKKLTRIEEA